MSNMQKWPAYMKAIVLVCLVIMSFMGGYWYRSYLDSIRQENEQVKSYATVPSDPFYTPEMVEEHYRIFEEYGEHVTYQTVILDLRRPEDYAAGHLDGAVNVPFELEAVRRLPSNLPDDYFILIYSYGYGEEKDIAELLKADRYFLIYYMDRGYDELIQADGMGPYVTTKTYELKEYRFSISDSYESAVSEYFDALEKQ